MAEDELNEELEDEELEDEEELDDEEELEEDEEEEEEDDEEEDLPEDEPSVAEAVAEIALPIAKAVSTEWLDKAIADAKKRAEKFSPQTKGAALDALDVLASQKGNLADLGEEGFKSFLSYLSEGKNQTAKDHFIRTKMGPKLLIANMRASTDGILKAKKEADALEATVNEILVAVTNFGIRLAFTALFA